jgi:hypothetical protein
MKKITLFFISTLFVSLFSFAENIDFDSYGNVQLGAYENFADNQTVTVTVTITGTTVTGPGWGIGKIFPINLSGTDKYEFKSTAAGSEEGTINTFDFTIAELKEFAKVDGVYHVDSYGQSGITINLYNGATLTSITVGAAALPSTVFDFEADAIGTTYGMKAWNSGDGTATVEANPTNAAEKSVHIITSNWNAVIALPVTLPAGKTLADIESLSFDVYITNEDSQNKKKEVYIDGTKVHEDDGYPNQGALNTWTTKNIIFSEFSVGLSAADLAKSTFTLAAGISTNNGNYFIDNITLNEKPNALNKVQTAPAFLYHNGIISVLNSKQADITVFNILGKQILSVATASTLSLSNLPSGIYIIKVKVDGQNNTAKIVK